MNILVSSFDGLDVPKTLCIPLRTNATISALFSILSERLPNYIYNLRLTTSDNKALHQSSQLPVSTLVGHDKAINILPLRLCAGLLGGKGGFGSQLRAAGGRMSSRKKRDGEANASSRNLDGRRLRTVTEAKKLAEYLATKPEMERKEKEERRRRWESIVEAAERKEDEIKHGRKGVRLDGEWVEKKEEEESKVREAVSAMLNNSNVSNVKSGSESEEDRKDSEGEQTGSASSTSSELENGRATHSQSFHGWDEDELSDDEEEIDTTKSQSLSTVAQDQYEGKGKAKATA